MTLENNTFTQDLISRLIVANTASLRDEIALLKEQLSAVNTPKVVEFETEVVDSRIICDETLDIVKSLPEFSGKNSYVSWRAAAINSMSLYNRGSRKYFGALTILRNKIIGEANDTLTNHGTCLNMDAIIARLDFAYSDKRPIHIIEQELSVLRQGNLSVMEYYNLVNKKLTLLINKTIMTHGSDESITKELNRKNRQNALRIFITGLKTPLSDILFSLCPEDLPNALAKAQELEANNLRARFALNFQNNGKQTPMNNSNHYQNQYNRQRRYDHTPRNTIQNNLRFPKANINNQNQIQEPVVPMEVDPSVSNQFQRNNSYQSSNRNHWNNSNRNSHSFMQGSGYHNNQTQKRVHESVQRVQERFYEIENLEADILIGYNILKRINAVVDLGNNELRYNGKTERIYIDSNKHKQKNDMIMINKYLDSLKKDETDEEINSTFSRTESAKTVSSNLSEKDNLMNILEQEDHTELARKIPGVDNDITRKEESQKILIYKNNIIKQIQSTHSKINTSLPFRTDVRAEIRTNLDTPIWSKQYPYPLSCNNYVNDEIARMRENGVIRPSKSPYNSPIWIVPKKGNNEDGTGKHRLVIDYKKINEHTIADTYPIPDPSIILSNLGNSKYFSTIDLESGFHQILMRENDIEKTAFSINNGKSACTNALYEYMIKAITTTSACNSH
ncbi:putative uncharacterized protein DDB_G0282499 [Teleopsis dalmanni]|uniref:putative uncharacterized protein DDB_G0282499 n=1 Tax=Teleopsis dalmanni TaxID=139649 RepID=UPI0018CE24E3|nr:putative uncharacterized protein DDB_G0282499 [Teleopsis dalmanni]